jgi:hypothetical protein
MLIELGHVSAETKGIAFGPQFDSTTVGGKRLVQVQKID